MTEAAKDQNYVNTLICALDSDGKTPVRIKVNPITHTLCIDDGIGGSDLTGDEAPRDNNQVPVAMGVSSVDGKTPVPIYGNSSGEMLVNSN